MMPPSHLEAALNRIRRIVLTASQPHPPLTEHESFEQIVEELELAGLDSPAMDPELEIAAREFARVH